MVTEGIGHHLWCPKKFNVRWSYDEAAGFFALASKLFGPRSPLVISDQTIWILTIGPFLPFYLVRAIKRAVKGSAEELVESMADATH